MFIAFANQQHIQSVILQCACRAAKPLRDLEEIMLHEQQLAADAEKAEADNKRRAAVQQAAVAEKGTAAAAAATMAVACAAVPVQVDVSFLSF